MRFTVIWLPAAEQKLTEIWLASANKPILTRLIDELDADLRNRPLTVGESRDDVSRIAFAGSVVAEFEVHEADCRVIVSAVWRRA